MSNPAIGSADGGIASTVQLAIGHSEPTPPTDHTQCARNSGIGHAAIIDWVSPPKIHCRMGPCR